MYIYIYIYMYIHIYVYIIIYIYIERERGIKNIYLVTYICEILDEEQQWPNSLASRSYSAWFCRCSDLSTY